MLKPYAYLDTRGKSRDVSREAPNGARVALHFPELGRTIELEANAAGRYTLIDMPAPGTSGPTVEVVRGELRDNQPGSYNPAEAATMREAARMLRNRVDYGLSNIGRVADLLDAMAKRMEPAPALDTEGPTS